MATKHNNVLQLLLKHKQELFKLLKSYLKNDKISDIFNIKVLEQVKGIKNEIKIINRQINTINFIKTVDVNQNKTLMELQNLIQNENEKAVASAHNKKELELAKNINKIKNSSSLPSADKQTHIEFEKNKDQLESAKDIAPMDSSIVMSYVVLPETRILNDLGSQYENAFNIYKESYKELTSNEYLIKKYEDISLQEANDTKEIKTEKLPTAVFYTINEEPEPEPEPVLIQPDLFELEINSKTSLISKIYEDFSTFDSELDVQLKFTDLEKNITDENRTIYANLSVKDPKYIKLVAAFDAAVVNKIAELTKSEKERCAILYNTNALLDSFNNEEKEYILKIKDVSALIDEFKKGKSCAKSTAYDNMNTKLTDTKDAFIDLYKHVNTSVKLDKKIIIAKSLNMKYDSEIDTILADLKTAYTNCTDATTWLNEFIIIENEYKTLITDADDLIKDYNDNPSTACPDSKKYDNLKIKLDNSSTDFKKLYDDTDGYKLANDVNAENSDPPINNYLPDIPTRLNNLKSAYDKCIEIGKINKIINDIDTGFSAITLADEIKKLTDANTVIDYEKARDFTDLKGKTILENFKDYKLELESAKTDADKISSDIYTAVKVNYDTLIGKIDASIYDLETEIKKRNDLFVGLRDVHDKFEKYKKDFLNYLNTDHLDIIANMDKSAASSGIDFDTEFKAKVDDIETKYNECKVDLDADYNKSSADLRILIDNNIIYTSCIKEITDKYKDIKFSYDNNYNLKNLNAADAAEFAGFDKKFTTLKGKINVVVGKIDTVITTINSQKTLSDLSVIETTDYATVDGDITSLLAEISTQDIDVGKILPGKVHTAVSGKWLALKYKDEVESEKKKMDDSLGKRNTYLTTMLNIMKNIADLVNECKAYDAITDVDTIVDKIKLYNATADLDDVDTEIKKIKAEIVKINDIKDNPGYDGTFNPSTTIESQLNELETKFKYALNKISDAYEKQNKLFTWYANKEYELDTIKYSIEKLILEYLNYTISNDLLDDIDKSTNIPETEKKINKAKKLIKEMWDIINSLSVEEKSFIKLFESSVPKLVVDDCIDLSLFIDKLNTEMEKKIKECECAVKVNSHKLVITDYTNKVNDEKLNDILDEIYKNNKYLDTRIEKINNLKDLKDKINSINLDINDPANASIKTELDKDIDYSGDVNNYLTDLLNVIDAQIKDINDIQKEIISFKYNNSKQDIDIIALYMSEFADVRNSFLENPNYSESVSLRKYNISTYIKILHDEFKIDADKFNKIKYYIGAISLLNVDGKKKTSKDVKEYSEMNAKLTKISKGKTRTTAYKDFQLYIEGEIKKIINAPTSTRLKIAKLTIACDLFNLNMKSENSYIFKPFKHYKQSEQIYKYYSEILECYKHILEFENYTDSDLGSISTENFIFNKLKIKIKLDPALYDDIKNKTNTLVKKYNSINKKVPINGTIGWIHNSCYFNCCLQLIRYICKNGYVELNNTISVFDEKTNNYDVGRCFSDEEKYIYKIINEYKDNFADKSDKTEYDDNIKKYVDGLSSKFPGIEKWELYNDIFDIIDHLLTFVNKSNLEFTSIDYKALDVNTDAYFKKEEFKFNTMLRSNKKLAKEKLSDILITVNDWDDASIMSMTQFTDDYGTGIEIKSDLTSTKKLVEKYKYNLKDNKYILFKLTSQTNLDFEEFVEIESVDDKPKYEVVGIFRFIGGTHYSCILKEFDGWYEYNDMEDSYKGTVCKIDINTTNIIATGFLLKRSDMSSLSAAATTTTTGGFVPYSKTPLFNKFKSGRIEFCSDYSFMKFMPFIIAVIILLLCLLFVIKSCTSSKKLKQFDKLIYGNLSRNPNVEKIF